MKDNQDRYGTLSRFFHWTMAAGFAFIYYTAVSWTVNEDNFSLMPYHKAVGFILLVLVVLRLVWAAANRKNRPYGNFIVRLGHLALYALMLLIPTLGMLRQYGSARGSLEVFGLTVMDKAPEKIEWMTRAGDPHGELGFLLLALVAGHIVMAVVHQIKGEKIINRMAGPVR